MQENIISHKNIALETKALLHKVRGLRLVLSLLVFVATIIFGQLIIYTSNHQEVLSSMWGIALMAGMLVMSIAWMYAVSLLCVGLITYYEQNNAFVFKQFFVSSFALIIKFAVLVVMCKVIALGGFLLVIPYLVLLPAVVITPAMMLVSRSGYISSLYSVISKLQGVWFVWWSRIVRMLLTIIFRVLFIWLLSLIVEISLPFVPISLINTTTVAVIIVSTAPYLMTYSYITGKQLLISSSTPPRLIYKVMMYISLVLGIALVLTPLFLIALSRIS